jgi:hypothetical protein
LYRIQWGKKRPLIVYCQAVCKAISFGMYAAKIMTYVIPGTLPAKKSTCFIVGREKKSIACG